MQINKVGLRSSAAKMDLIEGYRFKSGRQAVFCKMTPWSHRRDYS